MREPKLKGLLMLFVINLFLLDAAAQAPERYSIVIDEILPDPTPVIGLPGAEFIELKNVSNLAQSLWQWKLTDGSATATISIDYILQPDSFVVICPISAISSFSSFGSVIGVSNFPSLNNEGDVISLYSRDGKCVHAVPYQLSWFNNAIKSEGGWTLEMIDTKNPCSGALNWKASIDSRGGTPGRKNSVDAKNPDEQSPAFLRSYVIDSLTIIAAFDESMDSSDAADPHHFSLDNTNYQFTRSTAIPPLFREIELKVDRPLETGKVYHLMIAGVRDCSHHLIGHLNKRRVGLPTPADTLDMLVNEILFNPTNDGVDFVEIYNGSEKILDFSRLYIANRNAIGVINTPKKISEIPFLIFPGDYIAISENSSNLQQHYFTRNTDGLVEITLLPSFPDDRGCVVILNEQGKIIDELKYEEDWQFALLQNKEGVALERIDPKAKTQLRDNWTSAASSVGYGTPGLQNSQFRSAGTQAGLISIAPTIFSPDSDGSDDICFINYEMAEPNYVANVFVYDVRGTEITRLYNNATLSQKGTLRWDGLGENNRELPVGIYILYTEVYNLSGKTKRFKNVVTLARKF